MVSLINPANGMALRMEAEALIDNAGNRFPIVRGVPRICSPDNYTQNFGFQWNRFDTTQLDPPGFNLSVNRFFAETNWSPADLKDQDVLEVGSGAGRFTRVILERTEARLWSVDYSNAVEANLRNNGNFGGGRLNLFQASIYEMPFPDRSFDKVFCLGVLQHTPDFEASINALIAKTKCGGEIVVDFYPIRGWWTKLSAKYVLRPLTRHMQHERLMKLIDNNIDWLMSIHRALVRGRLGWLTRFLPIADLRYMPKSLSKDELREWAVLDTFDMFSPEYDRPQRIDLVASMFERAGAHVTLAGYVNAAGARAAVVRAVKTTPLESG